MQRSFLNGSKCYRDFLSVYFFLPNAMDRREVERFERHGLASPEEVLAEYEPIRVIKRGRVLKALRVSTGRAVFLKKMDPRDGFDFLPGIRDELALTFALQLRLNERDRRGFVRPVEWFRAPISFRKTEPMVVRAPTSKVVMVVHDEGAGLVPLLKMYPHPLDPLRLRWLARELLQRLTAAYEAIGFVHHDLHSGNVVLGGLEDGDGDVAGPLSCCSDGVLKLIDFGASDAWRLRPPPNQAVIKNPLEQTFTFDTRCVGVILFNVACKYQGKQRFDKNPEGLPGPPIPPPPPPSTQLSHPLPNP